MYWLGRRSGVWLAGDPYADLALGAIREREQMVLLEREPRYGDNARRPARKDTGPTGKGLLTQPARAIVPCGAGWA
jgi:hypothetical protein